MAKAALCEQCGIENAAVFVLKKQGGAERKQALCLKCAEKLKIPAVREYMKQCGKTDAAIRMCEQCGELPATVFASVTENGGNPEKQALCAFCARKTGIRQVTDTIDDLALSDEELRRIHTELLNSAQASEPENIRQRLRRIFRKS
ncbi:MAG: hypothetical protein IKI58_06325 [Oscillospiraceae bacterium]|nr:hypothetical protein [Oscillospiraceae bacterium]